MLIIREPHRVEPSAEYVPFVFVPVLDVLCICRLQPLHAGTEIRFRRLEHQMEMVVEKAVRQTDPSMALDSTSQPRDERTAIAVVVHYRCPAISLRHDVMERSCRFLAKPSWHWGQDGRRAHVCLVTVGGVSQGVRPVGSDPRRERGVTRRGQTRWVRPRA